MRCPHCYQKDYSGYNSTIDAEKIFKAVRVLAPKTIIIYGGEPMLYPKLITRIFDKFEKDINIIIATNGTIWNKSLFDRAYMIMTTLESFFFNYSKNRVYNRTQYNNLIRLIKTYKDKISLTHNLYPKNNDPYYLRMTKLGDFTSNPYPIID